MLNRDGFFIKILREFKTHIKLMLRFYKWVHLIWLFGERLAILLPNPITIFSIRDSK